MSQQEWWVVGRIAGALLPRTEMQIGKFIVGPLRPGVAPLERQDLTATPSAETHFISRCGDISVKADCYFAVPCLAPNSIAAIDRVNATDAPLLQVALSLREPVTASAYRFEILWAENGVDGMHGAPSGVVGCAFWQARDPTPDEWAIATRDLQIVTSDRIAAAAACTLSKAIQHQDTSSASAEATLLEFFKVIEIISRAIAIAPPRDLEKRQEVIVNALFGKLKSRKGIPKKVSAVNAAERAIGRLDARYIGLRIESTAGALRLSDEWKLAAVEFAAVRNRHLGHVSSRLSADELHRWLDGTSPTSGQALARRLFTAYVDSLRKRRAV